jgi:hypothetical protein
MFPKGAQGCRGLAKLEVPMRIMLPWKPTPVVDLMFVSGKRHTIGSVKSAETSRHLPGFLDSHDFQEGQRQADSGNSLEHVTTTEFLAVHHV